LQDDGNVYPEIPIAPRGRKIEEIPSEGEELPPRFSQGRTRDFGVSERWFQEFSSIQDAMRMGDDSLWG
jgi:hypothetical protein